VLRCSKIGAGRPKGFTGGAFARFQRFSRGMADLFITKERIKTMPTSKSKIVEVTEEVASKPIEATASSMQDGFAKATAGFGATQAKMKEGVEKAVKTAEELVAFNQGNIEAFVKSSQIWATGVQELSKQFAAAAQASLDESIAAFKALTSVKSLKDAFELQSSFARAAIEKSMAESGKLTDASFKLTEQALAPITARVSVAVEKFAKTP
jgi:phasin family protein